MFLISPYNPHTNFRRLQSKRGKNCLLDGSLLARLADQMLSFQEIPAVVSSIKLLRCIAATESAAVAPFVESKQFCESASMFSRLRTSSASGALFLHFCSKANIYILWLRTQRFLLSKTYRESVRNWAFVFVRHVLIFAWSKTLSAESTCWTNGRLWWLQKQATMPARCAWKQWA